MTLKAWKTWLESDHTVEYEAWKKRNGIAPMPRDGCGSEKDYDFHDEDNYCWSDSYDGHGGSDYPS